MYSSQQTPLLGTPIRSSISAETVRDVTNVYINIEMHGVSPSWKIELEGIFSPEEWNALIERINQTIKRNPARYLAAFFGTFLPICFIGFAVMPVFSTGSTGPSPFLFLFFVGAATGALGLLGSFVYSSFLKQNRLDKVLAELSSENAARGISFRIDRIHIISHPRQYFGDWLVVSF